MKVNIWERVVWTAVQAFFGALPPVVLLTDLKELRAIGVSALVAVIAALISLGKNLSMLRMRQIEGG